jgi:hypothetical protein
LSFSSTQSVIAVPETVPPLPGSKCGRAVLVVGLGHFLGLSFVLVGDFGLLGALLLFGMRYGCPIVS